MDTNSDNHWSDGSCMRGYSRDTPHEEDGFGTQCNDASVSRQGGADEKKFKIVTVRLSVRQYAYLLNEARLVKKRTGILSKGAVVRRLIDEYLIGGDGEPEGYSK